MRERPILFTAPMVRAILDDRKTMTRRAVKCKVPLIEVATPEQWNNGRADERMPVFEKWGAGSGLFITNTGSVAALRCPYGQPGDRLIPAVEIPSLGRNYCADVFGTIWSRAQDKVTWKKLKGTPTDKGYLSITPAVNNKYTTRLVHRLIAEAFYGKEPIGFHQVRHLNGNQLDNAPENLDWGTQEQNWSDRIVHGRGMGENHHAAKLTKELADGIKKSNMPQRWLAAHYRVTQSSIWAIKRGIIWNDHLKADHPNMPRWASRITLEITNVRVERLQEITEEDAIREGVVYDEINQITAVENFMNLWEQINGNKYPWESNPWVFVISFNKLD